MADTVLDEFGQLFVMAFDGERLTPDVAEFFREFRIGGVILFADNFRSPQQLRDLTAEIQERCAAPGRPMLIATDHEGGRVQRFRDGFTIVPPMAELGAGDPAATEAMHRTVGRELRAAGVTFNLAPVADLCAPAQPGCIGARSFGAEPGAAARHVAAAVRGLQDEGVLACAKHFPGHGFATADSHQELPVIDAPAAEIDARELVPFRAALDAGVAAVMTAHVLYPAAGDPHWPASISPFWLTEVLRGRMGFDGVIVSDAIEMKALVSHWPPEECGLRALRAGTDLLIYYKEASQFPAFLALREALERGDLDPAGVGRSLERLDAMRARLDATAPAR